MNKSDSRILVFFLFIFLGMQVISSSNHLLAAKQVESSQENLLKEISGGFSRIAKQATPAVVCIESFPQSKNDYGLRNGPSRHKGSYENPFDYFNDEFFNRFFGLQSPQERPSPGEAVRGTGFIVTSNGYIMTNNHVVDNSGKINVTLHDGRKYPASIIGLDPKTDLAVIKIEALDLPYLTFGNSDKIEVGDWAIAIGNPFGLQATVTVGVISAKGRNQLHIADFEDFIQTDAAINPGNSGGPLLNINGQVIGINTAIFSGTGGYLGIGFAIPSLMVSRVMDQLIKDGQVTRGFLGVTLQPIDADLADFYKLDKIKGVLVTDVVKGSPADKAGIRQEDIIIACNGKEIESLSSFRNAIALMSPKSRIVLKIYREGKIIDVPVTIISAPGDEIIAPLEKIGVKVQVLTPELAHQFGFNVQKGLYVAAVEPDSQAALAGVKAGQLILAVNRKKVISLEDLENAIKDAKDKKILLMLGQEDVVRFVALTLED
ncbi:MAG: DegQ family serine endoprotease [Victivallaceae bacterium]